MATWVFFQVPLYTVPNPPFPSIELWSQPLVASSISLNVIRGKIPTDSAIDDISDISETKRSYNYCSFVNCNAKIPKIINLLLSLLDSSFTNLGLNKSLGLATAFSSFLANIV